VATAVRFESRGGDERRAWIDPRSGAGQAESKSEELVIARRKGRGEADASQI
jgi:hypothetical protein